MFRVPSGYSVEALYSYYRMFLNNSIYIILCYYNTKSLHLVMLVQVNVNIIHQKKARCTKSSCIIHVYNNNYNVYVNS